MTCGLSLPWLRNAPAVGFLSPLMVLLSCATTSHTLHLKCAGLSDCETNQSCMVYAEESGRGQTCEIPCRTTLDCPSGLECVRMFDGPPMSCQELPTTTTGTLFRLGPGDAGIRPVVRPPG